MCCLKPPGLLELQICGTTKSTWLKEPGKEPTFSLLKFTIYSSGRLSPPPPFMSRLKENTSFHSHPPPFSLILSDRQHVIPIPWFKKQQITESQSRVTDRNSPTHFCPLQEEAVNSPVGRHSSISFLMKKKIVENRPHRGPGSWKPDWGRETSRWKWLAKRSKKSI